MAHFWQPAPALQSQHRLALDRAAHILVSCSAFGKLEAAHVRVSPIQAAMSLLLPFVSSIATELGDP